AICRDWFSDLGFLEGGDTVILISESRSLLNSRVGQMPQLAEVTIPSPDEAARLQFIRWFEARRLAAGKSTPKYWSTAEDLAKFTAALSIHALRQLLVAACHNGKTLTLRDVTKQVEVFIQNQLGGDEVVAFKQPEHTRADVIGFRDAKAFIETDVLPGLRLTTKDALASIIICGAIGVGKTFLWEAVAGELGIPVLVLKNLRSKWFGETDVIFERLRRVLGALSKVLIYIEEADTAFGGVGADTHETERRLTGKLQGMMSDPRLRGKVHWLLDTARVHLLSADLRRPGRGGDLIFSMFDPEDEDRADFIRWTVESVLEGPVDQPTFDAIDAATKGAYAGAFSSLRAELRRKASNGKLTIEQVLAIVRDITPADIALERRYQTLQALLNCTRKSLRPKQFRTLEGADWDSQMEAWFTEAARLEAAGIN
ncbi:MAG: ATP-binding protein, partial [bacterium]|nr:ATP-binding protein [bacterium]